MSDKELSKMLVGKCKQLTGFFRIVCDDNTSNKGLEDAMGKVASCLAGIYMEGANEGKPSVDELNN